MGEAGGKERHFLTSEELRKLQFTELCLLKEFDRICQQHGIKYSIDGGTLLGAIRHGGFIPWDDDADVIMNRSAYDKWVSVCDTELNPEKFYFQDLFRTPGYRWGYGKLRMKGTKFVRLGQEFMPYEQGIFLDVFVCDNVPEFYLHRALTNFHSFLYRKAFYSVVGVTQSRGLEKIAYSILAKIDERILKDKYASYIAYRNRYKSEWVKCLTFPACNNTYGYKREWYEDTVSLEFEGAKLQGTRKYEEYLHFLYGDYMKLPPEEKRKAHPVSEISFNEKVLQEEGYYEQDYV